MRLENDLGRVMANGIRYTHAVLAQQPEPGIPFRVPGGQHAAVPRAHDLAWMKREAGDIAVRAADLLPRVTRRVLAADGTGRILDQQQTVLACEGEDRPQITRQPHLV